MIVTETIRRYSRQGPHRELIARRIGPEKWRDSLEAERRRRGLRSNFAGPQPLMLTDGQSKVQHTEDPSTFVKPPCPIP